jgi:hypothetical protein
MDSSIHVHGACPSNKPVSIMLVGDKGTSSITRPETSTKAPSMVTESQRTTAPYRGSQDVAACVATWSARHCRIA